MKQSPMLIFECEDFAVTRGEDAVTNPGIYGQSLARWLAGQLHAAGFSVGAVFAEDFGWCIPVGPRPHALYVVCASIGHTSYRWSVFAFAEAGFIARLLRKDRSATSLDELFGAVRRCLESAANIRELHEEQA